MTMLQQALDLRRQPHHYRVTAASPRWPSTRACDRRTPHYFPGHDFVAPMIGPWLAMQGWEQD